MTIMYNENKTSYYYKYDLNTNSYNEIYNKKNNGYTSGVITMDGNNLYYTDKDSNGKYNLYETINNFQNFKQVTKDLKIDIITLWDDKIFCRVRQDNHRNNNLAILNLIDRKFNIICKEETDSDIYNFQYNHLTHKIYTIERSIKERDTLHLPDIPVHKIVEYDEFGNRIKKLFAINGIIDSISVSQNGVEALISVSSNSSLKNIYLVDLKKSSKKLILKSSDNYTVSKPSFSLDEKGFYFLATTPNSKVLEDNGVFIVKTKGIYYYHFSTKKTSKIFHTDNGVVNDYNIQY